MTNYTKQSHDSHKDLSGIDSEEGTMETLHIRVFRLLSSLFHWFVVVNFFFWNNQSLNRSSVMFRDHSNRLMYFPKKKDSNNPDLSEFDSVRESYEREVKKRKRIWGHPWLPLPLFLFVLLGQSRDTWRLHHIRHEAWISLLPSLLLGR